MSTLRSIFLFALLSSTPRIMAADSEFIQWLKTLGQQIESTAFTREAAEDNLRAHNNMFERSSVSDEHPAYRDCANLLRIEVYFKPSEQPRLAAIERLYGAGKSLPMLPDDLSGRRRVAFYPSTTGVFIRIFAEVSVNDPDVVTKLLVDREESCPEKSN